MPTMVNPIFKEYVLTCTFPGCGGKRTVEYPANGGWVLGTIVPEDPSHPDVARCYKCKRHIMEVTKAPEPPKPPGPKGWNRIPTE
jgi:hypothetical protein